MARNQSQGGGGQQNQLFGAAWMQKFCAVEWLAFCDKSDQHVEAADLAARESGQDVRKELGPTGHGIVTAVNACKTHVDQLEASGQVDASVSADLKGLLDKLKECAVEDKKRREQERAAKDKKSKTVTSGEATKFHHAISCLIEIERRPTEAWLNSLHPTDRAQFIKAIAAMSPEQARRAIRDIANCADDNARMGRAQSDELIGQQEPSLLALALMDVARDDPSVAHRVEQHLDEAHRNDARQHAALITQLMLFDERSEVAAVLKNLGNALTFAEFMQKCRNRSMIR